MSATRSFAIVTGASTGIGFELAKRCAKEGYDLLIAADEPAIEQAATSLRSAGAEVEAVQADLATTEGVDKLYAAAKGRMVDALLANAGRGLGHAFLDQEFDKARHVIDTNVTGTVYLDYKRHGTTTLANQIRPICNDASMGPLAVCGGNCSPTIAATSPLP
jgi:short-subunit dehydrogenase